MVTSEDETRRAVDEVLGALAASSRPAEGSHVRLTCADTSDYQYPTHHFTTNAVIAVDSDTARCTSDVDCTATDAAGRAMLIAATYYDDLVRQYGEWRIKQRKLAIYYMTPILEPWSLDPATKLNLAQA